MKNSEMKINSKKLINAWCSYDIANSAYNLVISTVLFPTYYSLVTKKAFGSDIINILGFSIKNTVLYDYAIAAGYLVVVILSLLLAGIADVFNYRKRFMQIFTAIGAFSCAGLFFFKGENIALGLILPAMAVIGFAGSLVYYNSFLPLIATPNKHDSISAKGFSFGYAGSMLLLGFSLFQILSFESFGFKDDLSAIRFSFLEVGIWWLLIAQIAFYFLKEERKKIRINLNILVSGFKEMGTVFKKVKTSTTMSRFLLAFFFFSMGVQTIILVASLFGSAELGIEGTKLIVTILIIQVLAIVGATLFARISEKFGNKTSLITMVIIWILVCLGAFLIQTEMQFYIMAALVGLVMGGIQSQARSTFSKLLPANTKDTASYFTFYDSTEKIAIVLGMFGFGLIDQITGSMRYSALLLSSFFIVSLFILFFTPLDKE